VVVTRNLDFSVSQCHDGRTMQEGSESAIYDSSIVEGAEYTTGIEGFGFADIIPVEIIVW